MRGVCKTIGALSAVIGASWSAIAAAYPVNSTLTINSTQSSLKVEASSFPFSDSDTHNLTGTINAQFDFRDSGSFPANGGLTFTGGAIAPNADYNLTLGFPPVLGVNINASGLVGTLSTPLPPGLTTRTGASGVVYQFDASQYLLTINQGTIVVTGSADQTTDLSQEPVTGSAMPGTLGTMTFTTLGNSGPYTQLSAAMDFPIDVTQTTTTDSGMTVDLHLTGAVRATSSFWVALSGIAGDFNQDGMVSAADLPIFKAHYGMPSGATAATGDADANGRVDGSDFLVWQRTQGIKPPASGVTAVPEPAAGVLAFVAIALTARRRMDVRWVNWSSRRDFAYPAMRSMRFIGIASGSSSCEWRNCIRYASSGESS
jgi:hypothetical protein